MLSPIQLFATPGTVAHQALLSTGFSRQEHWSGLPFLLQGIFLIQRLHPSLLYCRQILYHWAQRCCTQHASKFGKLSSGHRTKDWKRKQKVSFHSNPKERQCQRMFKYHTIVLISHASKVMLKILQAGLQQYMNHELPDVQAGFRKDRRTRDQTANICWIIEKARGFQKKHLLLCWLCQSLWLCGPQQTLENSYGVGTSRAPDLPLEKSVCRSVSNS